MGNYSHKCTMVTDYGAECHRKSTLHGLCRKHYNRTYGHLLNKKKSLAIADKDNKRDETKRVERIELIKRDERRDVAVAIYTSSSFDPLNPPDNFNPFHLPFGDNI